MHASTLRRGWRIGLRLFLLAIALFLLGMLALTAVGLSSTPRSADVMVVFGGKVYPDGRPAQTLQRRLDTALTLYRQGLAREVLVSGGVGVEGYDETLAMAEFLAANGVPRAAILRDNQGLNTYATAENTARLARERGWGSYLLVTNFYHLPRARLAFTRFGLTPVSGSTALPLTPRDFYYGLPREVFAYPAYWVREYPAR
jgi:uncharacterized SAM-binding protein YcdF (DUF218 family)